MFKTIYSFQPATFYIVSVIVVAVFLIVVFAVDKKFSQNERGILSGLLVGKDNRLSLSKFQAVLWTLVAVTSYITLEMINLYYGIPINKEIPPNLLALIGLNSTTMLLAKGITSHLTNKGSLKTTSTYSSLSDLYMNDDNKNPCLMKFQMLCWTVVAMAVYFINFFKQFSGEVSSIGFPDVDSALLYLMLIGQGIYLGDKAITHHRPQITGIIPLRVRPGEPFTIMGAFVENATTFTVNNSIPLDVIGWHTTPEGIISARVLLPEGLKAIPSTISVTATTYGLITNPYFIDIDTE